MVYSSSMAKKKIAVIPGDGIGKEVIPAAMRVVEAAGTAVEFTTFDWSADRYLKDGTTVPADGFAMLARDFDAIFVGALLIVLLMAAYLGASSVGAPADAALHAAGWAEIVLAAVAFYLVLAELANETLRRPAFPLFPLSRAAVPA